MKKGKAYTVKYRRKREGRTDYRSRLNLLTSGQLRVVLRRGIKNFTVQIVQYEAKGDKSIITTSSRELIKFGWKAHRGNLSSAYLTGYLCGLKAKKINLKEGIIDLGLNKAIPKSSFFAAAKGLVDSGFKVPMSKEVIPEEDRIKGIHVENYAKQLLKQTNLYNKYFSQYLKNGLKPEDLSKHFDETKRKIETKWQ